MDVLCYVQVRNYELMYAHSVRIDKIKFHRLGMVHKDVSVNLELQHPPITATSTGTRSFED